MTSNYVRSLVRTWVPVLVAAIVTALAHAGIPLPDSAKTALASVIGGIVGAAYYALARALERRYPKLGWLLGAPGVPTYAKPVVAAPVVQSNVTVKAAAKK